MNDLSRSLAAEKQLLNDLNNYVIMIGIVSNNTDRKKIASVGLTNAELMFIHENGSPMRNLPARPVLEKTITWVLKEEFSVSLNACIEGIMNGWTRADVELELNKLCMRMETHARKMIYDNTGELAPNAPSVAKRKKGNHPLFDTGQLARSITCTLSRVHSGNSE